MKKKVLDATKIPEGTPMRDFAPCQKARCHEIEECWQDGYDPKDCQFLANKWPEPNQL